MRLNKILDRVPEKWHEHGKTYPDYRGISGGVLGAAARVRPYILDPTPLAPVLAVGTMQVLLN